MIRIAKSLITIMAVAVIGVGATGAYFASMVSSPGNGFASGTMTINVNGQSDPAAAVFAASNLAPGDVIPQGIFTVNNTGTINGNHLDLTVALTAGNGSDLANNIVFSRPDGDNALRFGPTTGANDSINIVNYLAGGFNDADYDLYDGDDGSSLFGILPGITELTLQQLADLGRIRIVADSNSEPITAGTTANLYINGDVSSALTTQGESVSATFTWELHQDASQY
jgi:hypothetical protein